jgi:fatty-acyl-CoA synthase
MVSPDRLTLPALFAAATAAGGDRVVMRANGRSTSYADLDRAVRELARGLVGVGVGKGMRVALLMGNRPEWAIAAFAVARVGAVLVPVSTFAAPDERAAILAHSDAALLLAQPTLGARSFSDELGARHPALMGGVPGRLRAPELPYLRRVALLGQPSWADLLAAGADVDDGLCEAMADAVTPADDALIVYTSGTTAAAKAVLHGQRAPVLQSLHFARYLRLGPEDRLWTTQPFFWTAGFAVSLGATLAAGARLVVQEIFEPGAALALLEAERVTAIRAWPHQEQAMAEHPDARSRDLSTVTKLNFRSPLAPVVGLTEDRWGTQGGYGLSETFTVVTDLPADAPAALRDATSGAVLPGMEVRIVDVDTGAPAAAGKEGEILVKGRTLMRGYYKELGEDTLDADGYFHTGDAGFVDADAYLHWTGRHSSLIKTGGASVSPLEIERALIGYPGLRRSVALGVPHDTLGELVVLCAVPAEGATVDGEALRRFLRKKIAGYKVPRRVLVMAAAELPTTGTDKVRLAELRALVTSRLTEPRSVS